MKEKVKEYNWLQENKDNRYILDECGYRYSSDEEMNERLKNVKFVELEED